MANKLTWVMEMIDRVSGPAKSAGASMGDFIQTTHSALAAVQLIGQAAIGAGRMIASGLQPAISREKSLGAFETLLGTAKQARDMYGQAVKFAAETPFETAQVVDAFQRLLTARFSEEEVPIAMRIIGDAASMQEDSQAAVQSVTRALSQIRSKGRLQADELMSLQEAVPLNTVSLYEKLGKIYGVNADRARKMQEAGQIDAQAASFAVLEQLSEQFGGNMARASKQMDGILSTLASRPAEFLAKLQDTRGYDALRDALNSMATAFDPETSGLTSFVTQLGSGVLERAATSVEYLGTGIVAFAEGLVGAVGPMDSLTSPTHAENMAAFRDVMASTGSMVGGLASIMATLVSWTSKFYSTMYEFGEWLSEHPIMASLLAGAGGAIAGGATGSAAGLFIGGAPGAALGGVIGSVAGGVAGLAAPTVAEYAMESSYTPNSVAAGLSTQNQLVAQRNLDRYGVPVGHALTDVERSSYASLAGMGRRAEAETYLRGLGTVQPINPRVDAAMMEEMLAASGYGMSPEDMADAYGLPQLAGGGIVRRPTVALIGEAGPEAVVPLGGSRRRGGAMPPISASFVFHGFSGTQEAAQDIRREVEAGIYATLERWALQSGRYA